jgi:hypothetical protein
METVLPETWVSSDDGSCTWLRAPCALFCRQSSCRILIEAVFRKISQAVRIAEGKDQKPAAIQVGRGGGSAVRSHMKEGKQAGPAGKSQAPLCPGPPGLQGLCAWGRHVECSVQTHQTWKEAPVQASSFLMGTRPRVWVME